MKKFSKNLIGIFLAITLVLGFTPPTPAHAALASDFLGLTSTYAVFGDAGIIGGAASHVWGDAGENAFGNGTIASGTLGTYYAAGQPLVVSDISSAYGDLAGETQTGTINLAVPNTIVPGVYDVGTTATFTAAQTLSGAGTYIFRGADSIAQTAGGTMTLTGGACASNVYWRTGTQMTFAATGNIEGTIIAGSAITFANSALTFKGRALAGTNVDLGGITITEPICSADLSITKTVDDATPSVGDTIVYTVTVTNGGPDAATGVAVTDLLPAGLSYVSNVPSQGTYISSTGVWTVGAIANGASKTLAITATVDTGTGSDTITNTAEVTASDQTDADSTPDNDILAEDDQELVDVVVNTPVVVSHSSGGGIVYGCKDITATNYNFFSSSKPELCTYAIVAPVVVATPFVTPTVIVPKLPKTGFPPQEPWYMVILSDFLNLIK